MEDQMQRFEGKVIVIAGAATGIGAETARRLASEGGKVIVGDINFEGAKSTAAGIVDAGGEATPVQFDLGDEASISALMQTAVDTYGGIDCLFNNGADVRDEILQGDTDVVGIDMAIYDHILEVDLKGYVLCCRYAIPRMLERGAGSIVCTSSSATQVSLPFWFSYAIAKSGVLALVHHVAGRWGKDGIRCNAISPGGIFSESHIRANPTPEHGGSAESILARTPISRVGTVVDAAATVAYLLSEDAGYINAHTITLNGGSQPRD
jgi:NAD(P)-dependent dehydrogenase (short-subunit alcohol dehydrogenase family)